MQGNVSPARSSILRGDGAHSPRRSRLAVMPLSLLALVALSMMLVSCGGTSSSNQSATGQSDSTTPASTTEASVSKAAVPSKATHAPIVEKVQISSPAFQPAGPLPTRYTCDGANSPPLLRWSGIPAGTAELSLYLIKVEPVDGHLTFSWAVAGIDPKSHGIQDGKLPPGAVVGLNSEGKASYDLCPPKNTKEEYVYVLLALPHSQHPKPGFNAATQRILDLHNAEYQGFLVFTYPRH
jgi:phosphatidylethanolamine-binding protein (PEBP) family uncharacterized protein